MCQGVAYLVKTVDLPMATQPAQALPVASKKSSANRNIFPLLAIQDSLIFLDYFQDALRARSARRLSKVWLTSKCRRYTGT